MSGFVVIPVLTAALFTGCIRSRTSNRPLTSLEEAVAPAASGDWDTVADQAGPGVTKWTRIDDRTVRFEGRIESTDVAGFDAIIRPGDLKLLVNSFGGDIEAGLTIAQHMLPYRMTVVVDGVCASSCANYLFTAGAEKQLQKGWVGYHGNATAIVTVGWSYQVAQFKENGKISDDQIPQIREQFLNLAAREQAYLNSLGIAQAVFDKAWLGANGPTKTYSFLCPTPATFEAMGIKNVQGHQDPTYGLPASEPANVLE